MPYKKNNKDFPDKEYTLACNSKTASSTRRLFPGEQHLWITTKCLSDRLGVKKLHTDCNRNIYGSNS